MTNKALLLSIVLLFPLLVGFNFKNQKMSLWDRMCESCHDGKTILNGNTVMGKEQMKAKYKNLEDLVRAVQCDGPPCMNILKHDEPMIRIVGKELGLKDTPKKEKGKMLEVMEGVFGQKKAKMIEEVREREKELDKRKKCLEAAQDLKALEKCRTTVSD